MVAAVFTAVTRSGCRAMRANLAHLCGFASLPPTASFVTFSIFYEVEL